MNEWVANLQPAKVTHLDLTEAELIEKLSKIKLDGPVGITDEDDFHSFENIFTEIKINGREGITDGGELLRIVRGNLYGGGIAKAASITAMLIKNWVEIWEKLNRGLEVILDWIRGAWMKVKEIAKTFWEWLFTLFG
ncbi:hypothetical protein EG329_012091 [Mollisiaceae sp. DMI_Dod_QoI]|nr:hypothetical protein EG329_012091 [Helotiales sp. DMI_Dod_QoI]